MPPADPDAAAVPISLGADFGGKTLRVDVGLHRDITVDVHGAHAMIDLGGHTLMGTLTIRPAGADEDAPAPSVLIKGNGGTIYGNVVLGSEDAMLGDVVWSHLGVCQGAVSVRAGSVAYFNDAHADAAHGARRLRRREALRTPSTWSASG